MSDTDPLSGIYIHVPFCLSKCRYCDFYSVTQLDRMSDYAGALRDEMAMVGADFPKADTLYFGGGTPSLLPIHLLADLIEKTTSYWDLPVDAEITLETNPAALNPKELQILKAVGINRLNIGAQSLLPDNLLFLGRLHSVAQIRKMVESARRAGFNNLGLDMMFGLPDQEVSQWEIDLQQAIDLNPEHLSCYILSYEPGTSLFESLQTGRVSRLDDQIVADQFRLTHALLSDSGYEHYEISNYAKQNCRSRHNCKYWNHAPYLGLGPSAHSYQHPRRWWNYCSLDQYISRIRRGRRPVEDQECLTGTQHMVEALYLGLRQSDGIQLDGIQDGIDRRHYHDFMAYLQQLIQQGLMMMENERYCLTLEGMLQSDHIIGGLIERI